MRELDGIGVTVTLAPGWSPHGPCFVAGIDPAAIDLLREHYHALNPWARVSSCYPEGHFGSGFQVISRSELRRSEYYADWMRPAGIGCQTIFGGLPVVRDGTDELLVAFLGLRGAREPKPEEVEFGRRIVPQLRRLFFLLERMQQSPSAPSARATADPYTSLTPRELQVLTFVAKGLTHRDCARLLSIQPATVKTHLKSLYRKLDICSRAEATREAIHRGLID